MTGSIVPDVKGGCPCGGDFKDHDQMDIYKVPKCSKCKKYPSFFRVARTLPVVGRKQIRYFAGKRLTDPFSAICCMKRIDEEVESGKFDIKNYMSVRELEAINFKNFADKMIKDRDLEVEQNKRASQGHRKFKSIYNNHLVKKFGKYQLGSITGPLIHDFAKRFKGSKGVLNHSIATLKTILKEAHKSGLLETLPTFPEIKKTGHRKNEFIDIETQQKIINAVKDPVKRKALKLCALYGLRTCEIRALQWRDIENKTIKIRRRFSGKQLLNGRKAPESNCPYSELTLPFIEVKGMDSVQSILKGLKKDISPEGFIFVSKNFKPLGERELYKVWVKACEELKISPRPDLYSGTKHATASELFRSGMRIDEVRELLGHTSVATTERYAKSSLKQIKVCVERAYKESQNAKILKLKRK